MEVNKPNEVRVSLDLLPCPSCGGKAKVSSFPGAHNVWCENQPVKCGNRSMFTPDQWNTRAQPADQQGEPIALSEDVREYLQEGIENATGCEDSDVDYDFAEELAMLLGPLYRHAQPATAKVDENAEFEGWRNEQCASLERMGYPDAAKKFRELGSIHWAGWQARAKLNGGQPKDDRVKPPRNFHDDDLGDGEAERMSRKAQQ